MNFVGANSTVRNLVVNAWTVPTVDVKTARKTKLLIYLLKNLGLLIL